MVNKTGTSSIGYLDYSIVFLAVSIGGSSLVATVLFLLLGPLFFIDLGLGQPAKQFLNALLCLAFFTQHSGMIRQSVRDKFFLRRSDRYYAAVYAIVSGIGLWSLIVLWQPSGNLLFSFEGLPRLLVRSLFVLSIFGFVWGNKSLGDIDGFGIEAVLKQKTPTPTSRVPELSIKGPYQFVRHPLYLCMLMMIWSFPDWTSDRLLLNILWSGWIVLGARWEERDLVNDYGKLYEDYQRRVPMLVPFTRIR
jgi:protein-S-isoprenylcysteine O-methyltransferase Ste14